MKICVFGLTVSSSWGNGHATHWRGLCRALGRLGHEVAFFERDVAYYAAHRDLARPPGCDLYLYGEWDAVAEVARAEVATADAAIVTSYCPDALRATELVLRARTLRVFYDLDTPVTLERLASGADVPYLPAGGLGDFDLVLSYAGGPSLEGLRTALGARRVAPLYGAVDPDTHRPIAPSDADRADLSFLGTYAPDRQAALDRLFFEPARRSPERRFLLAGAQYPSFLEMPKNVIHTPHVAPPDHASFFARSRATLNVSRAAMARAGYCPSGRLFEAAACGVPIITDAWPGLERFFEPGREVAVATAPEHVQDALDRPAVVRVAAARAALARVLAEHTAEHRARELVALLRDREPGYARERA